MFLKYYKPNPHFSEKKPMLSKLNKVCNGKCDLSKVSFFLKTSSIVLNTNNFKRLTVKYPSTGPILAGNSGKICQRSSKNGNDLNKMISI